MKKKDAGSLLGPDSIDFLRRDGKAVSVAEGDIIIRRGSPGKFFYVVLSGEVEVRLVGPGGSILPLARMGEGDFFGEMSLITGEPVSADVVALNEVTVLAYPGELFSDALARCEPLRTQIMSGLVDKLRGTSTDAWNFFQKAETLNVLRHDDYIGGPLVVKSARMRKIAERITLLAGRLAPVLITGKAGTGKAFVAAKIHKEGHGESAPLIMIDCRSLPAGEAGIFIFGSSRFLDSGGKDAQAGSLQRYGALHLAQLGTLVLSHIEVLGMDSQRNLENYLALQEKGEIPYPSTRIIATTRADLGELAKAEKFDSALAERLSKETVTVPALSERRPDILPLASLFLHEDMEGRKCRFHKSGEHALVSQRYSYGNASELREAVEMAALFADGEEIGAEHVFAGPKEEESVLEFDLKRLPMARRLTSPLAVTGFRAAMFIFFLAIIFSSLALPRSKAGMLANTITWGFWEPALIFLFFFVGRVWCTVCPLSTAGRLVSRLGKIGIPPPGWLKKYTSWIIIAGFIAIIWSEYSFYMFDRPFPSGILLLTLMVFAVGFAVVFRRETWCRYVCPLGNMGAIFALPAMLNVRANPSVCSTYCKTHDCYKGSKDTPGCPVFHHPLYARDGHHCKLCFTCLKSCPHGSAKLYLRPLLQGIWGHRDLGGTLVPFMLFFFFYSFAMLAVQSAPSLRTTAGFTAATLLSLVAATVSYRLFPRILPSGPDPDPSLFTRAAFAMLVLAWGPAMAYQLKHVPELESLHLHIEKGSLLTGFFPVEGLPFLSVLQLGTIVLAACFAAATFRAVGERFERQKIPVRPLGKYLLGLLCLFYFFSSLAIILG